MNMRADYGLAHECISFYSALQSGAVCIGSPKDSTKMQNPAVKSGACKSWGRKESLPMILLVLTVLLIFLRKRRTKLKIELEI